MAIRNLRYDGDPILQKTSREVEIIDDNIRSLVEDMFETMYKFNGVGLSAPQIGILKRIIVVDTYEENEKIALINPVIIKTKGEELKDEGCLSFPGLFGKVVRPKEIIVEGFEPNGKKVNIKAKGLLAQAISHEIDHLNGIVFVDLVDTETLAMIDKQGNKLYDVDYNRELHKVTRKR